ncbi:hypothetical protein HKX48_008750 [Thoreauomyces humboldtii]|nr:hypothetical protein HKX48_008750 [Thoreauomyces humboldtii]
MTVTSSKEDLFLEWIKTRVTGKDIGNPEVVIREADAFAQETHLMAVGESKGLLIDDILRKKKPMVMIELGGYLGYSAVRFARLLNEHPDAHYYSFELEERFATIARDVIRIAGLEHRVTIVVGHFQDTYKLLKEQHGKDTVDVAFIDHDKPRYLPDLHILLENRMVKKDSILIADNILRPGAPAYLAFVQSTPLVETQYVEVLSGSGHKDAITISKVL